MFKSIRPVLEDDHMIRIFLSNAAQKDIFAESYRQRLQTWLMNRFVVKELDIETAIDIAEANEAPYTDEQKFNYLQGKYPIMKDFKKTFNLDFT
jgi:pantothenate kinase